GRQCRGTAIAVAADCLPCMIEFVERDHARSALVAAQLHQEQVLCCAPQPPAGVFVSPVEHLMVQGSEQCILAVFFGAGGVAAQHAQPTPNTCLVALDECFGL